MIGLWLSSVTSWLRIKGRLISITATSLIALMVVVVVVRSLHVTVFNHVISEEGIVRSVPLRALHKISRIRGQLPQAAQEAHNRTEAVKTQCKNMLKAIVTGVDTTRLDYVMVCSAKP